MEQKDVKNFLIKKSNNIIKKENLKYVAIDEITINTIVRLLFDGECKEILNLTEEETNYLRIKYKIIPISNLEHYSKSINSIFLNTIRAEEKLIKESILIPIRRKARLTSVNKEIENNEINLYFKEKTLLYLFKKYQINTIGDLFSYSTYELYDLFDSIYADEIINKMHEINLRFVDELTIDEKRNIISGTACSVVSNSSIYFIHGIENSNYISDLRENNIDNIHKLKIFVKKNNITSLATLASMVGIKMNVLLNNSELDYYDIDMILDITMLELYTRDIINVRIYNLLVKNGLYTLRDVISKSREELQEIFYMGIDTLNQIEELVHSLGLVFSDEIDILNYYTKEIERTLTK